MNKENVHIPDQFHLIILVFPVFGKKERSLQKNNKKIAFDNIQWSCVVVSLNFQMGYSVDHWFSRKSQIRIFTRTSTIFILRLRRGWSWRSLTWFYCKMSCFESFRLLRIFQPVLPMHNKSHCVHAMVTITISIPYLLPSTAPRCTLRVLPRNCCRWISKWAKMSVQSYSNHLYSWKNFLIYLLCMISQWSKTNPNPVLICSS